MDHPHPVVKPPEFTNLLLSRRRGRSGLVRRAAAFGAVAALYAVAVAALLATQLLVVESVNPPKAAYDPIPVFRAYAGGLAGQSNGPSGSGGMRALHTQAAHAAPPASGSEAAPAIRPLQAPPVVVPLVPPASDAEAETVQGDWIGSAGAGAAEGTGGRDGDGPGSGPGGGAGCAGCTGDGRPGGGGDEDVLWHEDDPQIVPPVIIPSSRALPVYPTMARRAMVEGTVELLIVILRDGHVGEIQVLRSPDARYGFDLAAIEAVKLWRYRPALLSNRPVVVQASVIVEFTLAR